jgi:hypothetical protein
MADPHDWSELTRLTGGERFEVERVRLVDRGVAIEGRFVLPSLAGLSNDDQVFIAAFVRSHGSIKQMEELFGISYPTVKNRLNRIATHLPLVDVAAAPDDADGRSTRTILDRLEQGQLSAADAAEALRRRGTVKEKSEGDVR